MVDVVMIGGLIRWMGVLFSVCVGMLFVCVMVLVLCILMCILLCGGVFGWVNVLLDDGVWL